MEKQKMLYQQARLHDRGAAEMVLQMISASKGTVGKLILICLAANLLHPVVICIPPGRLGATVTFTLKLGISILNGGNILVQQVCIAPHAGVLTTWDSPIIVVLLFCCRKCWTTWRRNGMLDFSKACPVWWYRAGNEYWLNRHASKLEMYGWIWSPAGPSEV